MHLVIIEQNKVDLVSKKSRYVVVKIYLVSFLSSSTSVDKHH